jgi:hypothetical protein
VEIKPIPDPPPGLREAALRGTLIPFVGAGASRIAGCPNWSEFADAALRFFVDQGKFSHGQLAQISYLNPRVKLSIALGLQKEHNLPIDFRRVLYSARPAALEAVADERTHDTSEAVCRRLSSDGSRRSGMTTRITCKPSDSTNRFVTGRMRSASR